MLCDEIHTIVFVNPQLGLKAAVAIAALKAVTKSPNAVFPLKRIVMTSQAETATTDWSDLQPFISHCLENGQTNIRVFSSLIGLKSETAEFLAARNIYLAGEWSSSSFGKEGLHHQSEQFGHETALSMLDGIEIGLRTGALKALEFQVTRDNIQHADSFIDACDIVGIEPHFEMQERPCKFDGALDGEVRPVYLRSLPDQADLRKLAERIARWRGESLENLVPPFFQRGGPNGACEYIRGGVFLRPDDFGNLRQTVCLSNWSTVSPSFLSEPDPVDNALRHPLIRGNLDIQQTEMKGKCNTCGLWSNCRGGCRSMSYLATGLRFEPDPNCWH